MITFKADDEESDFYHVEKTRDYVCITRGYYEELPPWNAESAPDYEFKATSEDYYIEINDYKILYGILDELLYNAKLPDLSLELVNKEWGYTLKLTASSKTNYYSLEIKYNDGDYFEEGGSSDNAFITGITSEANPFIEW